MSAQVAADLRAAAEVLERDGWTQGRYYDASGCHCALGALAVVISGRSPRADPDRWSPAGDATRRLVSDSRALVETLGLPDHFPRLSTTDWNDADGRTAAEVIAALRAAAARVEADQ